MYNLDSFTSQLECLDCAVSAVLGGMVCYYFVPGAANSTTAMQIAGASFVSQIAGKWITHKFIRPMLYPTHKLVPPHKA